MLRSMKIQYPLKALKVCFLVLLYLAGGSVAWGKEISPTSGEAVLLSDLDLPVMPGFLEENQSRVVFDTPEGRIIEVQAHGNASPDQVRDYYQLVLPSLSWSLTGVSGDQEKCDPVSAFCIIASRDQEVLSVRGHRAEDDHSITVIIFTVRPR